MSSTLIAIIGVVYLYIAGESYYKDNLGVAVMFAGYAFANVGAYIIAKGA